MRDFESVKAKTMDSIENRVRYAYNRGFDAGYEEGEERAVNVASITEYDRGFNDAWMYARRITCDLTKTQLKNRGFNIKEDEFCDYSEYEYSCKVIEKYSASEVKAKLKEYESGEGIKVGDEVYIYGENYVVVGLRGNTALCIGNNYHFLELSLSSCKKTGDCRKTGKHYDDIENVLANLALKEGDGE